MPLINQPELLSRKPGAAPGIEHHELAALAVGKGSVTITCFDYSPTNLLRQEIDDLATFLADHRPEWSEVRWINVDGLSDINAIHALATKYNLHPLAIEDVLHSQQRPKVEVYGGVANDYQARVFIVTRVPMFRNGGLQQEQMSLFVGHNTVLSFQSAHCKEVWDALVQRVNTQGSRLRSSDASFLAYSLLDAVIDQCFPILEVYSDRAEELEDLILEHPEHTLIHAIHELKRGLLTLHRLLWPMREVVLVLQRDPHECMSETTQVYLRDLYDHVVELIDIVETYREMTTDVTETYMSSISNHMNEIMKLLTLIGTIFLPLTFLAGVYGMNFRYFPELELRWAYPAFWAVCLVIAVSMLLIFRHRRWL
uniref:Magnesium transport protein CorA n=1 Tax=Chlorobium chlorochromatii (strain CaD3) TaxID=340177 RepID=Q3AQ89_CHLCH